MSGRLKPLAALLLPLLLWGCLFEPGKFASTLTINADRSFTFTYKGEVIAVEQSPMTSEPKKDDKDVAAEQEEELHAVAEAMRKEPGIVSAVYVGERVFVIDYRTSGTLTHAFLFPFNIDAKMLLPFVAVELRGRDGLRIMAPGFANENKDQMTAALPTGTKHASRLDGVFTLITDAEIVSQNNEAGAVAGARGGRTVTWRATPLTKIAPMAVLKVAPLP